MSTTTSLLDKTATDISAVLKDIFSSQNACRYLQEAVCDIALRRGKCVRPFLVVEVGRLFGVEGNTLLQVAAALECVHCYSLIHDDLPAIDDGDMRRGEPTLHKKYDEATAILAGNGLLTLAFEILANSHIAVDATTRCTMVVLLAKASGLNGMVAGQMLDLRAEKCDGNMPIDEVKNIQNLKTGKLIQAAVKMGATLGKADHQQQTLLDIYAKNIGIAFQVTDDILDAVGKQNKVGKILRKDTGKNKATFASSLGIKGARAYAYALCMEAKDALESFGEETNALRNLADFIVYRET